MSLANLPIEDHEYILTGPKHGEVGRFKCTEICKPCRKIYFEPMIQAKQILVSLRLPWGEIQRVDPVAKVITLNSGGEIRARLVWRQGGWHNVEKA